MTSRSCDQWSFGAVHFSFINIDGSTFTLKVAYPSHACEHTLQRQQKHRFSIWAAFQTEKNSSCHLHLKLKIFVQYTAKPTVSNLWNKYFSETSKRITVVVMNQIELYINGVHSNLSILFYYKSPTSGNLEDLCANKSDTYSDPFKLYVHGKANIRASQQ